MVQVHQAGTGTPGQNRYTPPTMVPYPPWHPYTHLLLTWHPSTRHPPCTSPGSAAEPQHVLGKARHQAHFVKMEILTVRTQTDTVSQRQEWPGTDTLTTFQEPEVGRVLIVHNT